VSTVTVTGGFQVTPGQTLNFTNENGFLVELTPSASPDVLDIAGVANISLAPGASIQQVVGIGVDFFATPPANAAVTVASTGVLRVISTLPNTFGQSVTGFNGSAADVDFVNHGTVQVESNDSAVGAFSSNSTGWTFVNSGSFTVIGHGGQAQGVVTITSFDNSGLLSVSGKSQVVGVEATFPSGLIHNSGTILVTDNDPAADSVGVLMFPSSEGTIHFVNDGRIEADVALELMPGGTLTPQTYVNNGVLVGRIDMGQAAATLVNSGQIQGNVGFGADRDVYDGRLGSATGLVSGGAGDDSLLGGQGSDNLAGGDGADTVIGGAGRDQLSGGAGANFFVVGHGDSGVSQGAIDQITDWTSSDVLDLGNLTGTNGNYLETTATTYSAALALANAQIGSGAADIVAVSVGSDVIVFADTGADNGAADDAVLLAGKTLADVSFGNFANAPGAAPPVPPPPVSPPPLSPPPVGGGLTLTGTAGSDLLLGGSGNDVINGGDGGADTLEGNGGDDSLSGGRGAVLLHGGDGNDTLFAVYNNAEVAGGAGDDVINLDGMFFTDPLHLTRLDGGDGNDSFVVYAFPNQALTIDGGSGHNSLEMHYFGAGTDPIVLHLDGDPSGGAWVGVGLQTVTVVSHVADVVGGAGGQSITAPGTIVGGSGDDVLTGSDPAPADATQQLMALTGADTINGGAGRDTINGLSGQNYLRGDDGDDSIQGGAGFDDINGNKGDDTINGDQSVGSDWLVGGQNNDSITAHAGQNLIYGNLGADTLHGGAGGDVLRGGQGDDVIVGGSGADFVSGDRGNDTESGGAGADLFHGSQDAGVDRVLDFHVSEGDRVELDPGTTFTVSQVGADTVIDMGASGGGANQMILVGVSMSTLTASSIFLG
jgi:Ca2+-binding RTX toxin-like protein